MRKAKADGRRVLVVSHTHPKLTQGGGEIVAFETFRRLNATPGFEGFLLSHDAKKLPVRAGAAFTQPFGPREYLYGGRSFDHFLFANPDPNFARAFEALRALPGSILLTPRDPLALAEAILALPQAEPAPAAALIETDPLSLYRRAWPKG